MKLMIMVIILIIITMMVAMIRIENAIIASY